MQVRAASTLTVRPAVKRPVAAPAPAPKLPVKARNADQNFGSDIFQGALYGLMNVGTIVPLPSAIAGLVSMLPMGLLGGFNLVMGGLNGFRDYTGMKKAGNQKLTDDYTRLAGDAAVVVGGVALLAGAAIAPVVPLIGAGLAAAGFFTRIVGIWNDDTRI